MALINKFMSKLFMDFRGKIIRVIQGRPADNNLNFTVDSFGSVVLPGPVEPEMDKGNITAGAGKLKQFLKEKGMRATRVIAGLGQAGVITRSVRVPKMTARDLAGMMKLEINDHLPVSPEEYAFDYKVVGETEEDGREYLELIVAAVNRKQADHFAMLLEKAGLKPVVFDILPNMLYRLFGHIPYRDILVIDGDEDGTRLAIFKGGTLFMYADVPFAVSPGDKNDLSALAGEMGGYLDYFSSRNFGKTVDNITVLGELAKVPGIDKTLGEFFPIPVTVGLSEAGPLGFKGKASDFRSHAALYAGVLGLMMRESNYRLPPAAVPAGQVFSKSSGASFGT